MSIEDIKAAVCNLTPKYFAGVRNKTREQRPLAFRDLIFRAPDVQTDRDEMYWKEIADDTPNFIPPVVCPCDDFTYITTTENADRVSATFPYIQLGATVDCDFKAYIEPEEPCEGDPNVSYAERIQRAYFKRQQAVEAAFDNWENLKAAEAFINQEVTFEGHNIKPYKIEYKRCETLNDVLTGDDQWGKKGCENPLNPITAMDDLMYCKSGAMATDVFMNQWTVNKLFASPFIKDCLKSYNPNVFVPTLTQSDQNIQEPRLPFEGARNVLTFNREGMPMRVWMVNASFDFLDPATGEQVKTNLMPNGKVIGVDLRDNDTGYGAGFAYGRIQNFEAMPNMAQRRFASAKVTAKKMEFNLESAPLPIIRCPDASWCLNVCPTEAEKNIG